MVRLWRPRRASVVGMAWLLIASAQAWGATDIAETVRLTVSTNPQIAEVRNDRLAIDQELVQARALSLPTVDIRASAGPNYSRFDSDRRFGTERDEGYGQFSGTALMRQRLFDGGATPSEIERQLARVDSAARRVTEAAELVGLDGVQAHLEVLRSAAVLDLARANLRRHESLLREVRSLADGGGAGIADVRQAESRTAASRNLLQQADGAFQDARTSYLQVVGAMPDELVLSDAPRDALPGSIDEAATLASTQGPTVLIAAADVDVAEAELAGSRSGYYPRFDLEIRGDVGQDTGQNSGEDYEASALVTMNYNLFRGGGDVAREREAFHRVNVARASLSRARRAAEENARIYWSALDTQTARTRSLREQVRAIEATRALYLKEFQIGRRSLLDVLDSEAEVFQARSALLTADFTKTFASYRVLAVTGRMLDALGVAAPREEIDIERTAGRDQTPERVAAKTKPRVDPRAEARPVRSADSGEPIVEGVFRDPAARD